MIAAAASGTVAGPWDAATGIAGAESYASGTDAAVVVASATGRDGTGSAVDRAVARRKDRLRRKDGTGFVRQKREDWGSAPVAIYTD